MATVTETSVEFERQRLACVLVRPAHTTRCAVLVHGGPGGNKDGPGGLFVHLAVWLADAGIASVRFDMLGCGESPGDYVTTTLVSQTGQLRAVIDTVQAYGFWRIGVVGESLGAASVLLEWGPELRTVALLWPAIRLVDTSLANYWAPVARAEMERSGFIWDEGVRVGKALINEVRELRSLEQLLPQMQAPTMMMHGARDVEVPCRDTEQVYSLLPGVRRLVTVTDGGHGLPDHQFAVCREVTDWLRTHL